LARAVVGPLESLGVQAEADLVVAMVADVNEQPGALPLLQFALTDLFDHREDDTMTLAAYQRLGGVMGALARRADEVYDALTPRQQATARQMFMRLIALGEGTEDTGRRALRKELLSLGSGAETALEAFDES